MASADCCRRIAAPRGTTSPRHADSSPRVRRLTFAPHTRHIYARSVRVALGFGSLCPLAHRTDASYVVRVPRTGALPSASFRPRLAATPLRFG